jgi:hypothetical protein
MEKVLIFLLMEIPIMVSTKMVSHMVQENILGLMEIIMMVNSEKALRMEKVFGKNLLS